jgi:hypothetical protein
MCKTVIGAGISMLIITVIIMCGSGVERDSNWDRRGVRWRETQRHANWLRQ